MKWFKHDSEFRHSPAMKSIYRKLGDTGSARANCLMELICGSGSADATIRLVDPYGLDWLAEEMRCSVDDVKPTLDTFATVGLIELTRDDAGVEIIKMPSLVPAMLSGRMIAASKQLRVGGKFIKAESEAEPIDPRIKKLSAITYDLTGFTPTPKQVADLLAEFSEQEILAALKEFAESLDDRDYKTEMRKFFKDGGCAVVIYAQKHR